MCFNNDNHVYVRVILQHRHHVILVCFKVKACRLLIYTIKNYMTLLFLPVFLTLVTVLNFHY